ncbi:hypothetical protein NEF87_003953 [Candidatus Lokiarchaeum ossiferum]|uniref:4Fe-4S ferredoxin-type domain-containing protein n=1 Tax=Candidatus Lokiarchaeum ossiferum TaxID=2951803 RepID=A0ABY6HVW6_9ARCH|nr:hypothetical protein NEF87_003953 [Candidatus Lokiarchaeum sp. B-35]
MKCNKVEVREYLCPKNHPCPSVRSCPYGAIVQDNPYSVPYILEEKCKHCGLCTRACPVFQCAVA